MTNYKGASRKTKISLNTHILDRIVERRIFSIRGQRVMLDSDLADLYGVLTKNLNKAVKRNLDRFPEDFMFQLSQEEADVLRFQIGTSKHGGRRYPPFVFTEHGVAMLSSVLNSNRAIQVNIVIMRTFIRLKSMASDRSVILERIEAIEKRVARHDSHLQDVFRTIKEIIEPAFKPKPRIGIRSKSDLDE